jgi:hypothetical protein
VNVFRQEAFNQAARNFDHLTIGRYQVWWSAFNISSQRQKTATIWVSMRSSGLI